MTDVNMNDAAFAANLKGLFGIKAGYYGGPNAFRVWPQTDWKQFAGQRKLPIWVAGLDGAGEAETAVNDLTTLGVPAGAYTAVDMEGRVDATYLENFGTVMRGAGYRVWVYGQMDTVFKNPPLNGYWVAWYAGIGPFMVDHPDVRATQYANGEAYDSSLAKEWVTDGLWI